jgi:hypothetical protein
MTTKIPACPKGKALFKAIDPEGNVAYRASARPYTHALAVYHAERLPEPYTITGLLGDTRAPRPSLDELPEGAYDIGTVDPKQYSMLRYEDGSLMINYKIDKMTKGSSAGWGIWSFHSSAHLADKAAGQCLHRPGDTYRVVEVEIVADRRRKAA